ncbi:MAG: lipid-A-disaccharide synthase N-terminal domain-containing protein [Deltaproteobacteria bacterium]|jgi:lipid-A-disaccharide synthase-like uncharacterized protein|nr:lipid-A-disaccharide synthase N-terminal domain-containing protein [Deltaproteobacteria bacterium]
MSLTTETIWISIGLLGQFLFSMRFIIQWIASEKKRQSVIPEMFWFFSISGGLVLLSYAIWRKDPVFILGQAFGVFIYARNIYFIYKRRENPAG